MVKYGALIGTATADISRGEHIHTHNLESDYLPTYTHDAGKSFVHGAPTWSRFAAIFGTDGRKGIRNVVAVAYLVECAHHVAREVVVRGSATGACISSASRAATRTRTPTA